MCRKLICLVLLLALAGSAHAGVCVDDDFTDGDFTNNPTWTVIHNEGKDPPAYGDWQVQGARNYIGCSHGGESGEFIYTSFAPDSIDKSRFELEFDVYFDENNGYFQAFVCQDVLPYDPIFPTQEGQPKWGYVVRGHYLEDGGSLKIQQVHDWDEEKDYATVQYTWNYDTWYTVKLVRQDVDPEDPNGINMWAYVDDSLKLSYSEGANNEDVFTNSSLSKVLFHDRSRGDTAHHFFDDVILRSNDDPNSETNRWDFDFEDDPVFLTYYAGTGDFSHNVTYRDLSMSMPQDTAPARIYLRLDNSYDGVGDVFRLRFRFRPTNSLPGQIVTGFFASADTANLAGDNTITVGALLANMPIAHAGATTTTGAYAISQDTWYICEYTCDPNITITLYDGDGASVLDSRTDIVGDLNLVSDIDVFGFGNDDTTGDGSQVSTMDVDWVTWAVNNDLPPDPGDPNCDDPRAVHLPSDINEDCYVNMGDWWIVGRDWLQCTNPQDPNCGQYYMWN